MQAVHPIDAMLLRETPIPKDVLGLIRGFLTHEQRDGVGFVDVGRPQARVDPMFEKDRPPTPWLPSLFQVTDSPTNDLSAEYMRRYRGENHKPPSTGHLSNNPVVNQRQRILGDVEAIIQLERDEDEPNKIHVRMDSKIHPEFWVEATFDSLAPLPHRFHCKGRVSPIPSFWLQGQVTDNGGSEGGRTLRITHPKDQRVYIETTFMMTGAPVQSHHG